MRMEPTTTNHITTTIREKKWLRAFSPISRRKPPTHNTAGQNVTIVKVCMMCACMYVYIYVCVYV